MVEGRKTATPSGVKGQCKLCLEIKYLCDSHLMPAALFRLLLSTTVTPRDPLLITPSTTFTTSRQVSDYLLCVDCEDKFRTSGEDWVLRHCYRGGKKFLLRDFVLKAKLLDDGAGATIYSARSNPDINCSALTFFAASVFWRAAVHKWKFPGSVPEDPIALGPYQELLRNYLLGEEQFPQSAAMWVWISRYDKPSRCVTTPHSSRIWNCHVHTFDIPGIQFNLFIGQTIPKDVRLLCVMNGPDRPILVSEAPDDVIATQMSKISQTTRLSKALQKKGKWSWGF